VTKSIKELVQTGEIKRGTAEESQATVRKVKGEGFVALIDNPGITLKSVIQERGTKCANVNVHCGTNGLAANDSKLGLFVQESTGHWFAFFVRR
jgi:hypothetical protein